MVYHAHMSREDPQMKIRLPAELKDQIEAASKELGRSMNMEIVARLQRSFEMDQAVEQVAFEHGFERTSLELEIERLRRLLEEQKLQVPQALEQHTKAVAAEVLKHLYSEAGETIEAARRAASELKAAGKWPIKRLTKKKEV